MSVVINDLCVSYGEHQVLRNINMDFPDKGVVCLCGPSGCGKTTLLNCLAGMMEPDSGSISGMEDKKISFVFQENRLLPWRSALENVAFVVGGDKEKAMEALSAMELGSAANKTPAMLSGGMQRRVAIARALAYGGDVLLMDEPNTGLDQELARRIMERVKKICGDILVIFITHDRELARSTADICYYMEPLSPSEDNDDNSMQNHLTFL